MFPYFYPTTVALIDDDLRFLQSFEDLLSQEFVVRRFASPQLGLNHLVGADAEHVSRIARLGGYATSNGWPADEIDRLQLLLSSYIGQLRGYPRRFETVSVAIIDLNMPDVDGLMICRALRRRPVRTILLTGNASDRLAVNAFNEGLIDRFVSKHDPDLITVVAEHVRDLQNAYFRRITTTIKDTLTLRLLSFMTEPQFLRYFAELCAERQIVEYYVRGHPPGVEIIRADGRSWILLVLDPEEIAGRITVARDAGADPEMLSMMESGAIIAQFPSEGGYYEARFRESWRLYAFPAKPISGTSRWLTAIAQPTAIRPMGLRDFVSFNEFIGAQVSEA
jgi:CheY-like chemotaxis protein